MTGPRGSLPGWWRNPQAPQSGFAPLHGVLVGALSGAVYLVAVRLWPATLAVALAVLTGSLLNGEFVDALASQRRATVELFYVLIKFNALATLSSASLPFNTPRDFAVPLLMILGLAAARALEIAALAAPQLPRAHDRPALASSHDSQRPIMHGDMLLALLLGLAPAALLELPGLVGVGLATLIGIACMALRSPAALTRQAAEVGFYLGAAAAWSLT